MTDRVWQTIRAAAPSAPWIALAIAGLSAAVHARGRLAAGSQAAVWGFSLLAVGLTAGATVEAATAWRASAGWTFYVPYSAPTVVAPEPASPFPGSGFVGAAGDVLVWFGAAGVTAALLAAWRDGRVD